MSRRYYFQGLNLQGQPQHGVLLAENKQEVHQSLRSQGIVVTKVRASFLDRQAKLTLLDISLFSRQLANLIKANLPLIEVLNLMAQAQQKRSLQTLIEHIKHQVTQGIPLSEALMATKNHFNALFCQLIRVGEQSGTLSTMLSKAAHYQESRLAFRKKIRKILSYPLLIGIIALLVTTGMLIFVVPQFQALFQGLGMELPRVTQALLQVSRFLQHFGILLVALLCLSLYAVCLSKRRSLAFAVLLEKTSLQLPFFGSMVRKNHMASFSRTLSLTYEAGLPLVAALKAAASATGSLLYTAVIDHIAKQVASGQTLHSAMQQSSLFSPMLVNLIALGEASGTLETMLNKAAELYEEEVERTLTLLGDLTEPLILSLLGLVVGGIVIALYVPIFQLGTAL